MNALSLALLGLSVHAALDLQEIEVHLNTVPLYRHRVAKFHNIFTPSQQDMAFSRPLRAGYEDRIGHYDIDTREKSELGRGAWGTVFPGKSLKTGDRIAAKKVTVETEFINAEVYKEADMLMKRLPPHEYVIRVHDFIRVDIVKNSIPHANFWLMMDFCESGNLKTYARNNDLDTTKKLEIMLFCSSGLEHLHDNRIVHRDLKPENILVGRSHKEVKISDFGTARTVDLLHGKSVTLNTLAGTMDYMAPELYSLIVDGVQPTYDKSVDLFSLGLCFLALLEAVKGRSMKTFTG